MYNENEISLTEATVLALQGKLKLEETKPTRKSRKTIKKEESVNINTDEVNVSVDDNGDTIVDTDNKTITVSEKVTENPPIEEPTENQETIDVPVEGDEVIVPEEEVPEETVEDIIDEPIEDTENEDIEDLELDEAKKVENKENKEENKIEEDTNDEVTFNSIATLFKQALTESKLTETTGYEKLNRRAKMNEIINELDKYRGKNPDVEVYIWDTIISNAKLGKTECTISSDAIRQTTNISKEDFNKLLLAEEGKIGLIAKMFRNEGFGYTTKTEGGFLTTITISWTHLADREKFKESKKVENKNGFSNKVKTEVIEDKEETKCENCGKEVCECDTIEQPIDESKECLVEEEPKYEWVLQGNYGYGWDDLVTYDSKEEAEADYKDYRENEPEYAHRIRKRLIKEESKKEVKEEVKEVKTETKYTFNKKSFEEALTKFYKFNSDKVESFKVESISKNKKGSIKIEGKLNNKVDTIMIFDKLTEGNSYVTYKLRNTNGILKESKDIVTSMFISKKFNNLNCRRIISK